MLRIELQNPLGILGTYKDVIADTLLGLNRFDTLDVSSDQTVVTWNLFFSSDSSLTGIGSGLTTDAPDPNAAPILTGGFLDGFGYHKPGTDAPSADIVNFDRDATVVQAKIDHVLDLAATNGWTGDQQRTALLNQLFDYREQKIIGSDGDDYLRGGNKADIINGNGGNDYVLASKGDDTIRGGAGNDIVDFSDLSKFGGLTGDLAANTVSFGAASSLAVTGSSVDAPGPAMTQNVSGFESFTLTSKADALSGNGADNYITGGGGADTISGRGGNDEIFGGRGDDSLLGAGGNDMIFGDPGEDTIRGNGGNDDLFGGDGHDSMYGNADNDFMSGNNGSDRLEGGLGNDTMLGGAGADVLLGGDGNDSIDGGGGIDIIYGDDGSNMLVGAGGNDDIFGGPRADTILGGSGNDNIEGHSGTDLIKAGAGMDSIDGGIGSDTMSGGSGDDTIFGDLGNDREIGGPGADTFEFSSLPQGHDTIVDFSGDDVVRLHFEVDSAVYYSMEGANTLIHYDYGQITLKLVDSAFLQQPLQSGDDVLISF